MKATNPEKPVRARKPRKAKPKPWRQTQTSTCGTCQHALKPMYDAGDHFMCLQCPNCARLYRWELDRLVLALRPAKLSGADWNYMTPALRAERGPSPKKAHKEYEKHGQLKLL